MLVLLRGALCRFRVYTARYPLCGTKLRCPGLKGIKSFLGMMLVQANHFILVSIASEGHIL